MQSWFCEPMRCGGGDCLARIDGDFALAIWDARRQEAFCARDRVGNKPFNYHWSGQTLVFASDLHAILPLPWVSEDLNEGMLAEYLATDWHSLDETFWQGILRLIAAHCLVASPTGTKLSRYWAPDLQATLPYRSAAEYIEHYRALFTDVVRRMSRSNRPLACEVSGGLDSSAIFAVAETLRQKGRLPAPGLEGYTLDFGGDPYADELDYCRAVGAHLGRKIHEVVPAHMPLAWYQDRAQTYREFPGYPNSVMALSILTEGRAHGARVLISGTGGDQWVGGCMHYYAEALESWSGRELLDILRTDSREVGIQTTLWWLIRFGLMPLLPSRVRQRLKTLATSINPQRLADWLKPSLKTTLVNRHQKGHPAEFSPLGRRGQLRQLLNLYDPRTTLAREMIERMCAYKGIEWRQPFWNAGLIQDAFATPERWRLRGTESKWLHRQAMAGLLPERVLRRPGKAEFSVVFARHWSDLSRLMREDILTRRQGWVNRVPLEAMLQQGMHIERSNWPEGILWTLFCVDAVLRKSQKNAPPN